MENHETFTADRLLNLYNELVRYQLQMSNSRTTDEVYVISMAIKRIQREIIEKS